MTSNESWYDRCLRVERENERLAVAAGEAIAQVARLNAELRTAAMLLREYEADAHPEDVGNVTRWLAVYDSRQKRAAGSDAGSLK